MRSTVRSAFPFYISARRAALLLAIAAQCLSNSALGGAPPPLTAVITSEAKLDLPSTFGTGGPFGFGLDLNQAGDFLFSGRQVGVFLRPAGAPSPIRLLQMGDEVPGYPGSRMDIISGMRINNAGLLVFRVFFNLITGENQGAIIAYDGAQFSTIAFGADPAPGTGGARYGSGILLTGLNDAGDVAFVAPVEMPGVFANRTTVYLARSGSEPIRVAGLGDPAPGTAGTFGAINGIALNSQGEILFTAAIVGGAGGFGLFVGSATGLRKVVAHGDPNPLGGSFVITGGFASTFLNNVGQTSFILGGSLFLHDLVSGLAAAVPMGSPAPPAIGGTFGNLSFSPAHALNDAGEIAFSAPVTGSAVTTSGIFHFRPDGPVESVAYQNQMAPGTGGERFGGFGSFSMNGSGQVSFRGDLTGGPIRNGVFRQIGSDPAEPVALDGDSAPVPGGGTLYVSFSEPMKTLEDGSVYFSADVYNGSAAFGEFLAGPGGIRALLSSAEPLPDSPRTIFRTFQVSAAGDYLAFLAARAGGLFSLMVHNLANGVTTRAITEGDILPGTGGAHYKLFNPNKVHVNSSGTIAFSTILAGGTVNFGIGLFTWNEGAGVTKIAVPGDVDPGTGATFGNIISNQFSPSPLNAAGEVVFQSILIGRSTFLAIFVGSAKASPRPVAFLGDPAPGGGIFLSFLGQQNIDDAGQVAFVAATPRNAIFLAGPGVATRKIIGEGDPGPSGSTFSLLPTTVSLNGSGRIGFMAALTGAATGGVFIGSTSQALETVALNGNPAPAGGAYFGLGARGDVLINDRGDLAFRSDLTGGSSNSGYFLKRSGGAVQAVALQGQPAPGSKLMFGTIPPTTSGFLANNMVLRQSGGYAFIARVSQDGIPISGLWRLRDDDRVENILIAGQSAPGSGGGIAELVFIGANDGGEGPVVLDVGVAGGDFSEAIYVVTDSAASGAK